MRVTVGSTNKTKVQAVAESVRTCPPLTGAEVIGVEVHVEQFGHPVGLEATVHGAMDRARQAFKECQYSFGIEGGLVQVPHTKSGYMEVAVCAIYDGKQFHLGISSGYEWPGSVTNLILHHGKDGSQAMRTVGLTTQGKIGAEQGAISFLTGGVVSRTAYNRQAVDMALVHLRNKHLYR